MFREKLTKKDLVEIIEIARKVMKRQNFGMRRSIVATKKFNYYPEEEEEEEDGGLLSHREKFSPIFNFNFNFDFNVREYFGNYTDLVFVVVHNSRRPPLFE